MKTKVGLWIDHKQAVIVKLTDQTDEIKQITSDVKQVVSDADAPHVSQQDRHYKRVDAHLSKYYEEVANAIHDVDSIFIFGPGEAKKEFQKYLKSQGQAELVVSVETTDSMTQAQIVVMVREYFTKMSEK